MLSALDYQVIRKVQHIIRNLGNHPYLKALIKLYKISNDNRFDRLWHQTDLGDRKPTELLSELCTLLGESCSAGIDLGKLLRKLFLDRLPLIPSPFNFSRFPATNPRPNGATP